MISGLSYYTWEWILLIGAFLVTVIASTTMNSTFKQFSKVQSKTGVTGREAAARIAYHIGLGNMLISPIGGNLTDHYDPRNKSLSLSQSTFNSTSLAALAVAAHECGHAQQDAEGYGPLRLRSSLVPVTQFASSFSWILIVLGLFLSIGPLCTLGVVLFSAVVLFQLVTLPVEFDASRRGLRFLEETGLIMPDEKAGARRVLTAAAMTYVAALMASIMQLLRLFLMTRRRD
ncbi:MAG: zinc metallopeptidase [Lachnospiraceae bacterium]|nr:zinc metallopeptidase [Candidatus Equihabitans merdae]